MLCCESQDPKISIPEQLERRRRDIAHEEWRSDYVQEDV